MHDDIASNMKRQPLVFTTKGISENAMPADSAWVRWAVLLSAILSGAAAIVLKGPNLDEFWTMIFADPRVGFHDAWNLWAADTTHPIGYYSLVRLWMEVFSVSVECARVLNLLFWAALGAYWLFSRANKQIRYFCLVFFVCVCATFHHLERMAEARAYFLAFALICLLATELKGLESGVGTRRRIAMIFAGSIGLALLDYPIFCAGAALLSVAAAALFLASRRAEAVWIVIAIAAGVVVLLAGMVNSVGHEQITPGSYSSMGGFARAALIVVAAALAGNLAISALSAKELVRDKGRGILREQKYREYQFKYVIVLATVVVLIEFVVLNLILNAILGRHLIPLTALVCASLAAWLPERFGSSRAAYLVFAAYVLSTGAVLYRLAGMDNLNRFADRLAAEQRKCRDFKIIPIDMFELGGSTTSLLWSSRTHASRFGQSEIARDYGFSLAPPQDRVMDARCGGAVWFVPAWLGKEATATSVLDTLHVPLDKKQRAGAQMFYENTVLVVQVPGRSAQ